MTNTLYLLYFNS